MTFPARLLDVTRLIRRAGRIPTGIDRVERAYLNAILADKTPAFGLARTRLGYLLLDEMGLGRMRDALDQADALSMVRQVAVARTLPFGLARMLRRNLSQGLSYLNVGHSNLTERTLSTVKQSLNGQISVFVHDLIPLTHPELQRP